MSLTLAARCLGSRSSRAARNSRCSSTNAENVYAMRPGVELPAPPRRRALERCCDAESVQGKRQGVVEVVALDRDVDGVEAERAVARRVQSGRRAFEHGRPGQREAARRRRWRSGLLWARLRRSVSARCKLRRPHPQGREAGRPSGADADQVRTGDQS